MIIEGLGRAISSLLEAGEIDPLTKMISSQSGKTIPHVKVKDIPAIRRYIEEQNATYALVSVQALAALLGRTPRILKVQASNDGHTVTAKKGLGGSNGEYIPATALAKIVTDYPRIPAVPGPEYKTERELLHLLRTDKSTLKEIVTDLGMVPGKYMVPGERRDSSFMATCYSPQQIEMITTERTRRRTHLGIVKEHAIARQLSTWATQSELPKMTVPPQQMVEQVLCGILRNKEAQKFIPSMMAHFTPRQDEKFKQLDGRTADLLNAMGLLYKEQEKRMRFSRQGISPDYVGQTALKLLLGSREDNLIPCDFTKMFPHLQALVARHNLQVTEEEVLQRVAMELTKLIDTISAPGVPGRNN